MKPIRLAPFADRLVETFRTALGSYTPSDTKGAMKFDVSDLFAKLTEEIVPPTIWFTVDAMMKIKTLMASTPGEIAWHGFVTPVEAGYIIYDVTTYPQTVSAAAVDSDDDKYPPWLVNLPDERAAVMRMQGHSHVNMSVSPSGMDTTFFQKMLTQIDDYYIFMISNLKGDIWINVYDIEQNILFEDKDLNYGVLLNDGTELDLWAEGQMENVETIKTVKAKKEPVRKYEDDFPPRAQASYYPYGQTGPDHNENNWFGTGLTSMQYYTKYGTYQKVHSIGDEY